MANVYNSDVAKSFITRERVRSLSYRGSLISTMAIVEIKKLDTEDITYICPIPYKSTVRSLRFVAGSGDISTGAKISIYGLKKGGVAVENKIKDLFVLGGTIGPGQGESNLFVFAQKSSSIYQQLCDFKDVPGSVPARQGFVPSPAFEPYKDDRFGMLVLTNTPSDPNCRLAFIVDYVENTPSSGPYLDTIGVSSKQPSAV